jgi:phytoene dehydrogenase-like protein
MIPYFIVIVVLFLSVHVYDAFIIPNAKNPIRLLAKHTSDSVESSTDVIIIGSGIAGLCCGSLLSSAGYKVTVFESHDAPGGCAHSWEKCGYHFESGPSLYSGFSTEASCNPLKNVFQIIGEEPEWITYDRWGTSLPEGKFAAKIGPDEFNDVLIKYGGEGAIEDWNKLIARMTMAGGLSEAAQATPSLALREDVGVVLTLSKYFQRVLKTLPKGGELNLPFSVIRDELGLKNKFVLNWLDMLCFLLQGLPVDGTMNAVIAYMLGRYILLYLYSTVL